MRLGALSVRSNPITAEGPGELSPPNKSATLHQTSFPLREKRERESERESKRDGCRSGVREESKENEDMREIDFSLTKFTRNGTGRGDVTASDNCQTLAACLL